MSKRHTIVSQSANEYPEHLNPFYEGNEDDGGHLETRNKFNTVGRRNSRLTASFRLRSWSMFSSKKPVFSDTTEDNTDSPNASRHKFSTLTPRVSRQILAALSMRKSKPSTLHSSTPTSKEDSFTIMPISGRERATPSPEEEVEPEATEENIKELPRQEIVDYPTPEPRMASAPVPLPRTLARPSKVTEGSSTSTRDAKFSTSFTGEDNAPPLQTSLQAGHSPPSHISEDTGVDRRSVAPRKKRQAPKPPTVVQPPVSAAGSTS